MLTYICSINHKKGIYDSIFAYFNYHSYQLDSQIQIPVRFNLQNQNLWSVIFSLYGELESLRQQKLKFGNRCSLMIIQV